MRPSLADLAATPEKIAILSPTGQDARLMVETLSEESVPACAVRDVPRLCAMILRGEVAAVVIAEEALNSESVTLLNETLARQAPWSDLPIILMTSGGQSSLASPRVM